ncbi:MAG TPA: cytochrome b/b6 domain-containing protein [Novosphingobium sp.]|nr:cytochrome b/b6 domain-containing protein [Novosphingobium sp.]
MDTDAGPPGIASARYTTVAIVLHWLIGALVVFEVGLGLNMEGAKGADKFAVFQLHKSVGITILLLVLLRVVWRFYRRPPPLNASGWEKTLARAVHGAFYLILLALPVSGWIIVSASKIAVPTLLYGALPWPHLPGFAAMAAATKAAWQEAGEFVHTNLVNVVYLLFALHLAGALKHHFIDRDGEFARMAPGTRAGSWTDPRLLLVGVTVVAAALLGLGWQPGGTKVGGTAATVSSTTVMPTQSPTPTPSTIASATAEATEPAADASATAGLDVSSWAIQPGSTLRFRTTWSGDAIAGGFSKFGGDIAFSPDRLDKSSVTITIDTGSVFSGDSQRDEALKGDEWFATGANHNAVFRASRFRKIGADRYVAAGTLRMKGVSAPVSVPFTLRITGDQAIMQGSATIDRLAYRIGEGEYASTTEIPASVSVDIVVKARRK